MGKGIPIGFYQGNRSEYLAIPALSKLGFTIPVPRQEDLFGVDFIVHLAYMEGQTVTPSGKSFGIQIKSNANPISFERQEDRDCLNNMSLPYFLGVVSRKNLTLTVYNTLNRLSFFWMKGLNRPFNLIPKGTGEGLEPPHHKEGEVPTGKPILKINIKEPDESGDRLKEIEDLQMTMKSWINLENDILSLKEQRIPLIARPNIYNTNQPIHPDNLEWKAFFSSQTLPDICNATQKTLTSLKCYLVDCLQPERWNPSSSLKKLIKEQKAAVTDVLDRNRNILKTLESQNPKNDPENSTSSGNYTLPPSLVRSSTHKSR